MTCKLWSILLAKVYLKINVNMAEDELLQRENEVKDKEGDKTKDSVVVIWRFGL